MFLLYSFGGGLDQPLGWVARSSDRLYSKNPLRWPRRRQGKRLAMVGVFWCVCVSLCHSSPYVEGYRSITLRRGLKCYFLTHLPCTIPNACTVVMYSMVQGSMASLGSRVGGQRGDEGRCIIIATERG